MWLCIPCDIHYKCHINRQLCIIGVIFYMCYTCYSVIYVTVHCMCYPVLINVNVDSMWQCIVCVTYTHGCILCESVLYVLNIITHVRVCSIWQCIVCAGQNKRKLCNIYRSGCSMWQWLTDSHIDMTEYNSMWWCIVCARQKQKRIFHINGTGNSVSHIWFVKCWELW